MNSCFCVEYFIGLREEKRRLYEPAVWETQLWSSLCAILATQLYKASVLQETVHCMLTKEATEIILLPGKQEDFDLPHHLPSPNYCVGETREKTLKM